MASPQTANGKSQMETDESNELPDEVIRMSTDEIVARTRLLDNEIRVGCYERLVTIVCYIPFVTDHEIGNYKMYS